MEFLFDLMLLMLQCIVLAATQTRLFVITLLIGALAGVLCWWACSRSSQLWNRAWRLRMVHHLLCAFAGVVTFCTVVSFISLQLTKDAALRLISSWEQELVSDASWQRDTFDKASAEVKLLQQYSPQFHNVQINDSSAAEAVEARLKFAEAFADEACVQFSKSRPFLSRLIWEDPAIPKKLISGDVSAWAGTSGDAVNGRRLIELAASQIRASLETRVYSIVQSCRLLLIAVFLAVQTFCFGVNAYAAYTDVKAIS